MNRDEARLTFFLDQLCSAMDEAAKDVKYDVGWEKRLKITNDVILLTSLEMGFDVTFEHDYIPDPDLYKFDFYVGAPGIFPGASAHIALSGDEVGYGHTLVALALHLKKMVAAAPKAWIA